MNISYYKSRSNTLSAKWPGKSVKTPNGTRKEGQIHLGTVIDQEHNVFWTKKRGYYTFNPEDQSFGEPNPEWIPPSEIVQDQRCRKAPVIVDFGDAWFLENLIRGIGYDKVIDSLPCRSKESLYSLLYYYILEDSANCHAEDWYKHSYCSYIYPKANISSQRISDLLRTLGTPEAKRTFLIAHIKYLMNSTDEELAILIDSTGMPNDCDIPYTCISVHEGDMNIEFRMIAVIQKSTGLPIYYELIAGNIIDITTLQRTIIMLGEYNCKVEYCIGDAGYACPASMERLVLSGIDFMARLNPSYTIYKKALEEHAAELENNENVVRYKERLIRVVKVPVIVGTDKETGTEYPGYIFLCKDIQAHHSKCDHLMNSKSYKKMTTEEMLESVRKLGIFAIVTTRDLKPEEVLPEYYIRQAVEQYFDYGKNCAKYLPVREHSVPVIQGHMLLSFITTFVIVLIKNRMKIMDTQYIGICQKLIEECPSDYVEQGSIQQQDGSFKAVYIQKQDPLEAVFRESPSKLFAYLRFQQADVFSGAIVPSVPVRLAKDFYEAFHISWPQKIVRSGTNLKPEYFSPQTGSINRAMIFGYRLFAKEEEQELLPVSVDENKKEETSAESAEIEQILSASENSPSDASAPRVNASEDPISEKTKNKGGRPPGSKNKKTLEREAREREAGIQKVKRGRGRPPGSKNKKTLEREALERAGEIAPKPSPKRGRPAGSKNKKKDQPDKQKQS